MKINWNKMNSTQTQAIKIQAAIKIQDAIRTYLNHNYDKCDACHNLFDKYDLETYKTGDVLCDCCMECYYTYETECTQIKFPMEYYEYLYDFDV